MRGELHCEPAHTSAFGGGEPFSLAVHVLNGVSCDDERADVMPVEPGTGRKRTWTAVPLWLRMGVYSATFLSVVLGLLPWLAYRLDRHWPRWHVEIGPARWLGVVLCAVAAAAYAGSSVLLSRRGRGAYVEFDPPQEFVAEGPFRWCRNPIAASLVALLLGEALLFSSTGIFLLFLVALPLAHWQVVYIEEPRLRRRFGAAYAEYVRRVPRWIPRVPRELTS